MGAFINETDLAPFATIEASKAAAMIEDAEAMAEVVAPCITSTEPAFPYAGAVKAVLRTAILRWNEAGNGAVTTNTAGLYSQTVDTSKPRKSLFWPSEIEQLEKLCVMFGGGGGGAYAVDTVSASATVHADTCALNFGGQYCSCGAVLTQALPLYENGWG